MPDEGAPHERTWLAFGASEKIWGQRLVQEVRRNLAKIARKISAFEPVTMLVRKEEYGLARQMVGKQIELVVAPLDDIWIRDTGPTFVIDGQGRKAAVDFNFNGWGRKQEHRQDAKVARLVGELAKVQVLRTDLVLEGGSLEVDGVGTAIIAESCVLNRNRNPGFSKAECERELRALLGLKKIIWIPGIRGQDITDGHTDFYARFAGWRTVMAGFEPDRREPDHAITKRHLEILKSAKDAEGNGLKVVTLSGPSRVRSDYDSEDFAAGYIGYYVCNGGVICQKFGDPVADRRAREKLAAAFPDRKIVQIAIDGIAAGGGSIHCATQQEPKA